MHSIRRVLFALAALGAVGIAPAQADVLSLYGLTGCFAGAVGAISVQNGVASGDCPDVSVSKVLYGGNVFQGANSVVFARSSPPGAPGSQGAGDPMPITLVGSAPTAFSLGTIQFDDDSANIDSLLSSVFLNLSFWFSDGAGDPPTVSVNDLFKLRVNFEGTNYLYYDTLPAQTWTFGGRSYEFSIAGFDSSADCSGDKGSRLTNTGSSSVAYLCANLRDLESPATSVPEPGSLALIAGSLVVLLAFGRRPTCAILALSQQGMLGRPKKIGH